MKNSKKKKRYYVVEVTEYIGDSDEGDVVFEYEYQADPDEDIHEACRSALETSFHGCSDGDEGYDDD